MKELRRFQYFKVVAENGSFQRAGKVLGLQESTISRAIRDLEDEIGASLFHRHGGGVSLMVLGEQFLQRIRVVLQEIGNHPIFKRLGSWTSRGKFQFHGGCYSAD